MATMHVGSLVADLIFRDLTTQGLDKLDRGVAKAERRMKAASRVAFGMGAALSAAMVGVLKAHTSLEAKISQVAGKTGLSVKRIRDDYVDALREIGQRTGETDVDLLDGLQKALSAGLRGPVALEAVDVAAQAAAAGIGNIGDQVSAATTIMTVFGGTGRDALNIIARAAQVGEGETQDFASAIKTVAGQANQLGLTAQGTAAGLAAVSQVAASVPEAATQMRSFLQSLLSPSEQAREEIGELEDSFANLRDLARREGLAAVLERVRDLGGGDPERLARLLGRTEAESFALTVDPSALANLETEIEATFRGTIARAVAEGADDIGRNLKQLRVSFKDLLEGIGEAIAPEALAVIRAVKGIVLMLAELPAPFRRAIGVATLFGPVLLGLAGALRLAATGMSPLLMGMLNLRTMPVGPVALMTTKVKGLGGALRGLSMSTWIGAAITALLLLVTHWEAVSTAIGNAINRAAEFFSAEGREKRGSRRAIEHQEVLVELLEHEVALGIATPEDVATQKQTLGTLQASHVGKYGADDLGDLTPEGDEAKKALGKALVNEYVRLQEEIAAGVVETRTAIMGQVRIGERAMTTDEKVAIRIRQREIKEGLESLSRGETPASGEGLTPEEVADKYGLTPPAPTGDTGAETQDRVPPPQRVEVRNLDVVDAITRQRAALVHELRQLGVALRGGEVAVAQPATGPVAATAPVAFPAAMAGMEGPTGIVPAPTVALPDLFRHVDALTAASVASQADQSTTTTTSTRNTNLGGVKVAPGAITVNAAPGQDPEAVAEAVTDRVGVVLRDQLSDLLEHSDSQVTR